MSAATTATCLSDRVDDSPLICIGWRAFLRQASVPDINFAGAAVFPLHKRGQGLSLSFGDVTFSLLFSFWSDEKRQAQLFSAVLSAVRGISGHNLSRPQHHNSTVVVTADDWQRECLCLYRCYPGIWAKSRLCCVTALFGLIFLFFLKKAPETLELEHLITPNCHFCKILGMMNQAADPERATQFLFPIVDAAKMIILHNQT